MNLVPTKMKHGAVFLHGWRADLRPDLDLYWRFNDPRDRPAKPNPVMTTYANYQRVLTLSREGNVTPIRVEGRGK